MITLWEMLENEKADPAHGRPLDLTRIYMANVMSHGDADRLTKEQELHDTEAREAQRADLYERVAAIAGGKKPDGEEPEGEDPERGRAKSEPTGEGVGAAGVGVSAARRHGRHGRRGRGCN